MTVQCSRFMLRPNVDKNAVTVLQVERTSVSLSLAPRSVHSRFTHSAPAVIRRVNTTWTRPLSMLAENSNPRGSHSTRSRPTSNPPTIPAKKHENHNAFRGDHLHRFRQFSRNAPGMS